MDKYIEKYKTIDIVNNILLNNTNANVHEYILINKLISNNNIIDIDIYKLIHHTIEIFKNNWKIECIIKGSEGYIDTRKYWTFRKKIEH